MVRPRRRKRYNCEGIYGIIVNVKCPHCKQLQLKTITIQDIEVDDKIAICNKCHRAYQVSLSEIKSSLRALSE